MPWGGHKELFEREREIDPDIYLWDACVMAWRAIRNPPTPSIKNEESRISVDCSAL